MGELPEGLQAALLELGFGGGSNDGTGDVESTVILKASGAPELAVETTDNGQDLVNAILGSGITIVPGSIDYTGSLTSSGFFVGGLAAGIGIESGIILTSGNAADAVGPNVSDGTTTVTGTGGDADLNALIPQSTNDVSSLEFDFISEGGDLFFNFVFASEEYTEFVNSSFNDVFAFFVDGVNIALIPGTDTPISINNVSDVTNTEFFNNNDPSFGTPSFNIEYDGFTDVFTVSVTGLEPGEHNIKLAIADAGDTILDSAIFIQSGSFSDVPGGSETADIQFFKELTVDGIIGDSDFEIADFGGSDAETSLENLVFTLTSLPTIGSIPFGSLILG